MAKCSHCRGHGRSVEADSLGGVGLGGVCPVCNGSGKLGNDLLGQGGTGGGRTGSGEKLQLDEILIVGSSIAMFGYITFYVEFEGVPGHWRAGVGLLAAIIVGYTLNGPLRWLVDLVVKVIAVAAGLMFLLLVLGIVGGIMHDENDLNIPKTEANRVTDPSGTVGYYKSTNAGTWLEFEDTPAEFSPEVPTNILGKFSLYIEIADRRLIGELTHLKVQPFSRHDLFSVKASEIVQSQIDNDIENIAADTLVVHCKYRHPDSDLNSVARYWYSRWPEGVDPARLRKIHPKHPLLIYRGPLTKCPFRFSDAH